MLHTDSYSVVGKGHERAALASQDYAEARAGDGWWQLALSDGCSGGGRTDIGARLLTLLALKHGGVNEELLSDLYFAKVHLGLDDQDLLATLLYAQGTSERVEQITIFGDGAVYEEAKGKRRLTRVSFPKAIPFYLSYLLSRQTHKYLQALAGERVTLFEYSARVGEPLLLVRLKYFEPEEVVGGILLESLSETPEKLILFSDGVESSQLSVEEVVDALVDLKNTTGRFLARRMKKQLMRWQKKGIFFEDDLSAAALVNVKEDKP